MKFLFILFFHIYSPFILILPYIVVTIYGFFIIIKLNEEKTKLSEQIDFYKEMESKYKDYKETSSKEIQRLKEKNYELFERIGMVDNIEPQKAEPVKSEEELKEDALNKLLSDFIK